MGGRFGFVGPYRFSFVGPLPFESMRHRLRVRCLATVTVLLVTLPASAWAAGGSSLHVDPASPVVKAYALPLGSARASSTPGGRTELFGSGIRSSAATTTRPTRTRTTPVSPLRGRGEPTAYRVLKPSPGSGLLWMGLVIVVVLGLGAGGALTLRRFR
jgi:hypothetical protein